MKQFAGFLLAGMMLSLAAGAQSTSMDSNNTGTISTTKKKTETKQRMEDVDRIEGTEVESSESMKHSDATGTSTHKTKTTKEVEKDSSY